MPVSSEEEAADFVAGIKKKYWDARHNCSAFIIGESGQRMRCSDDGEPAGTAGRPMLDVLANEKITDVCVVVTRYFGGTLLGTGGLVRAYSAAVKAGLDNCRTVTKIKGFSVTVCCDYTDGGRLSGMAARKGWHVLDTKWEKDVSMTFLTDDCGQLIKDVTDATSGRASVSEPVPAVFGELDGKMIVFS